MKPIIALWTHPRSISTAFERVMMERKDHKILHEPFSYLYYVHKKDASILQEGIDTEHPKTYPEIREYILKNAESEPVFFKDMCAHCHEEFLEDDEFLKRLTNTFLIRNPTLAIASYYAMNVHVTQDEIGLEQLLQVAEKTELLTGKPPVIVDATDLEDNPEGIMKAYCKAVSIPFIPEALSWDQGHKKEWNIWKNWHKDVAESTGIRKTMETYDLTIENSDHLRSYYEYHLPFYKKLYQYRIMAK